MKIKSIKPGILFLAALLLLNSLAACLPPPGQVGQPTPTPSPIPGLYSNQTYGISLRHPPSWARQDTGQRDPVVVFRAPGRFPAVFVSIDSLSRVASPKEMAEASLSQIQETAANFSVVSQGELTLGETPGYSAEFTWTSDSTPAKGRLVIAIRGSQLLQVEIISPATAYEAQRTALDSLVASLRLEEPQPFGIPRSQALTLADEGPLTLDPALSRELRSHAYITQIFSGLVAFDKDMNLVPDLAERWQKSPDGRIYTFYLRKNVKFHSGRPLTARDVKYSWERAARPETGSQTASTYLGDIVGVKEVLAGKAKEISGVKVLDDYTLEVTIDAPKAYFLAKLFYPVAYVVDRANVESGKEWWQQPNGTGPFRLRLWQKDELLVLERNPDYYLGLPQLPFIVFRLLSGIPMMMYENGEIDIVEVGGRDIERVLDETNPLHRELKVVPELSLFYLGFNHTRPPFNDARARRAFAMAIDKEKVVSRALRTTVDKADGILPPGMPGRLPGLRPLPFDPTRARSELATSGLSSPLPPVTLTVSGEGGDLSRALSAVAHQWQVNLGIEVKVRQLESRVYCYNIRREKDNIFDTGWIADYPDPQNFLDILFRTGGEENTGDYSNPALDALLDRTALEGDEAKRREMYHQAEQMLIDEAVIVPLWYGRSHILVKPYIKGFVSTPLGLPIYKGITLESH